MKPNCRFLIAPRFAITAGSLLLAIGVLTAADPRTGEARTVNLSGGMILEVVYIPPGEFMMGSTPEERAWATGIEGGATPGTTRESYEGEARLTRIRHGFWMGRTEVTVGQFRRFIKETGYVTDAEKPGGETQVFDPEWDGYHLTTRVVHPWKSMKGKSWRDPNWGFPQREVYPVVCVSWNDARAFCDWLTKQEREAGRLPVGQVFRLPTDAEWEYACRGGRPQTFSGGETRSRKAKAG